MSEVDKLVDEVVVRPGEAHDLPPAQAAERVSLNERRVALIQAWSRYRACIDLPAVRSCPQQQDAMDASVRGLDEEYRLALHKEPAK